MGVGRGRVTLSSVAGMIAEMPGRKDPHFNVFHAYRGPTSGENGHLRQLEDNLTRALGIVLVHLEGEGSAAPLLQALGVTPALVEKPFRVEFQVSMPSARWPPPSKRKLVAIVTDERGGADVARSHLAAEEGAARSDMVVLWDDAALVVESELTPTPDYEQMQRLQKTFDTRTEGECSWGQIARAAGQTRAVGQPAAYLLEQFEEYLRMNGFGGFTDEHFAFFAWSPERRGAEPVTKRGAQQAMRGLLSELKSAWDVTWEAKLGKLGDNDRSLWGKLEPAGGIAPHLSLGMSTDGLTIFANVETRGPFGRFQKAWNDRSEVLVDLLGQLGRDEMHRLVRNPWMFTVKRRVQRFQPSTGKILPRQFWELPAMSIATSTLSMFPALAATVVNQAIQFAESGDATPEILIERHYHVWQAVGDGFVNILAEDARQLEPFFAWLGKDPPSATGGTVSQ